MDHGEDGEHGQQPPVLQQLASVLHLDQVSFDVSSDIGLGGAFSAVLCNLSGLFDDDTDTLADLLNLIL